jgi:hypothetical protein
MIGFVFHALLLHHLVRITHRWKQPMLMMPPGGITSGEFARNVLERSNQSFDV